MSREIMIIAKDKNGVISNNIVKIGENGEHIVIKGTKDTFYEIKDIATNRAPDQIYTKRFKNDLKLKINPKGGALDGVGEADVTIENYCANGNCEIVGVHESGEYYQYVPQGGDADLGTTKMADGEFAYQSLGTVEAGGLSPLSALPLAGLAGLGGGGGSKGDTTAPTATAIISNIDDNVAPIVGSVAKGGHTNDTTPTLSGTLSEALGSGEVVAVYRDGIKVGTAAVDSTGTGWSFTDTGVTDGPHTYTVRAEDTTGNKGTESTPYSITVDTIAPDAPSLTMVTDDFDAQSGSVIWGRDVDTGSWNIDSNSNITISGNVNVFDGKIITNDNTLTFNGTGGEAGATIEVYNGTVLLGAAVVDNNGNWNVTIENGKALVDGNYSLLLTQTDTAGNISNETTIDVVVDTKQPAYSGEINMADIGGRNERSSDVSNAASLGENYYFTNEITLSDDYVKQLWNSTENIPYTEGDSIYITLLNEDTGISYLIGGPNGPSVVVGSDGKWSVSIYNADASDGTTNPATAYNTVTGKYETLTDGKYYADVLLYEPSGSTRNLAVGNFAIDTTAPKANEVSFLFNPSNTNNITTETMITIGGTINDYKQLGYYADDGDNIMERDQDYLSGTTAAEVFVYRDGTEIGHSYVGTELHGNWGYTETSALTEGVYRYQVDTMDVAGNTSGLGDSFWVYIDANKDSTYNLTTADDDVNKDFSNMVIAGTEYTADTFILDNVGFVSIDGAGNVNGGVDKFKLLDNSGELNITQTKNFEVYDIGNNTLNIGSNVVDGYTDHVIINGTSSSKVDLDTSIWTTSSTTIENGVTYNVYTNSGSDNLWIQTGVSVI